MLVVPQKLHTRIYMFTKKYSSIYSRKYIWWHLTFEPSLSRWHSSIFFYCCYCVCQLFVPTIASVVNICNFIWLCCFCCCVFYEIPLAKSLSISWNFLFISDIFLYFREYLLCSHWRYRNCVCERRLQIPLYVCADIYVYLCSCKDIFDKL